MARTPRFSARGGSSFGGQCDNIQIMYHLYVIESTKIKRKYIGITDDVQKRLIQHNQKRVRSTKAYVPWRLVYREDYLTKTEARKREIELKKNAWKRNDLFKKIDNLKFENK